MGEIKLKSEERIDDLQRCGYKIIQDPGKFCFGMDAVLLSGFTNVKSGENVIDLGTGTGIIPILLKAKTRGKHFIGVEIQNESVDMARRSVKINNLENDIEIIHGDIRNISSQFPKSSFEVVTTNPPYMNNSHGIQNPEEPKAIARHEIMCSLEDVVREGSALLKENGRMYMVHRPFRMTEIFVYMKRYRLEPKRMRLVYPYIDKEPNMVLIEAIKGANPWLKVESPLVVYDEPGKYTKEIYEIYGGNYDR